MSTANMGLWDKLRKPWSQGTELDVPSMPAVDMPEPAAPSATENQAEPVEPEKPKYDYGYSARAAQEQEQAAMAAQPPPQQPPVLDLDGLTPDQQITARFMLDGGRDPADVAGVVSSMHTDNEVAQNDAETKGFLDNVSDWWYGRAQGMEKAGTGLITSFVPFARSSMLRDELIVQRMSGMRTPAGVDRPVEPGPDAYRAILEAKSDEEVADQFQKTFGDSGAAVQDIEQMRDALSTAWFDSDRARLEQHQALKEQAARPSKYKDNLIDPVAIFNILEPMPAFMQEFWVAKKSFGAGMALATEFEAQKRLTPTIRFPDASKRIVEIVKDGDDVAKAYGLAAASTGIEYGTELGGGKVAGAVLKGMTYPLRALGEKVLGGPAARLAEAAMSRTPNFIKDKVRSIISAMQKGGKAGDRAMKELGFHGVKGEVLEEVEAAILHPVVGTQEFQTEPWQQDILDATDNPAEKRYYQLVWSVQNFVENSPEMVAAFAIPGMATAGLNMVLDRNTGLKLKPGETLSEQESSMLKGIAAARMKAIEDNEKVPTSEVGKFLRPWTDTKEYDWLKDNKDNPEELYRVYGAWLKLDALKSQANLPATLTEKLAKAKSREDFAGIGDLWAEQQGVRQQMEQQGFEDSQINYIMGAESRQDLFNRTQLVQRRSMVDMLTFAGMNPVEAERRALIAFQGGMTRESLMTAGIPPDMAERAMQIKGQMDALANNPNELARQEANERLRAELGKVINPTMEEVALKRDRGEYRDLEDSGKKELQLLSDIRHAWESQMGMTEQESEQLTSMVTLEDLQAFIAGDNAALSPQKLMAKQAEIARQANPTYLDIVGEARRGEFQGSGNYLKLRERLITYWTQHGVTPARAEQWANLITRDEILRFNENADSEYADQAIFMPERMMKKEEAFLAKRKDLEDRQKAKEFRLARHEGKKQMLQSIAEEGATVPEQIKALNQYIDTLRKAPEVDQELVKEAHSELIDLLKRQKDLEDLRSRTAGKRYEDLNNLVQTPPSKAQARREANPELVSDRKEAFGRSKERNQGLPESVQPVGEAEQAAPEVLTPTSEATIKKILNNADNRQSREMIGKWYDYNGVPVKVIATNSNSGAVDEPLKVTIFASRRVAGGEQIIPLERGVLTEQVSEPISQEEAPKEAKAKYAADETLAREMGPIAQFHGLVRTYVSGSVPEGSEDVYYFRMAHLKEVFPQELKDSPMPARKGVTVEDLSGIELPPETPPVAAPIQTEAKPEETKVEAQPVEAAKQGEKVSVSFSETLFPVTKKTIPLEAKMNLMAAAQRLRGIESMVPHIQAQAHDFRVRIEELNMSIEGPTPRKDWLNAYNEIRDLMVMADKQNGTFVEKPKPEVKRPLRVAKRKEKAGDIDPLRGSVKDHGGIRFYRADESGTRPWSSEMQDIPKEYIRSDGMPIDLMLETLKSEGLMTQDATESDLIARLVGLATYTPAESKQFKAEEEAYDERRKDYVRWLGNDAEEIRAEQLKKGATYSIQGELFKVVEITDQSAIVQSLERGDAFPLPFEAAAPLMIDRGSLTEEKTDEYLENHPGEDPSLPFFAENSERPRMTPQEIAEARGEVLDPNVWVPVTETDAAGINMAVEGMPHMAAPEGARIAAWKTMKPEVRQRIVKIAMHVAATKSVGDDAELMVALAEAFHSDAVAEKLSTYFPEIWGEVRAEVAKQKAEAKGKKNEAKPPADGSVLQRPEAAKTGSTDDAGLSRPLGDDGRRRIIRERDGSAISSDATVETFLSGAQKSGIPEGKAEQSVRDISHILRAYDHVTGRNAYDALTNARAKNPSFPTKPKVMILGYETGTGKTFVGATIMREIQDRLKANAETGKKPRILWVTNNVGLISQIKNDTKDFGLTDVTYKTYADMRKHFDKNSGEFLKDSVYAGEWDFVFFDEAHAMKNIKDGVATALSGKALMESSKMAVYSTATPFENPAQLQYMRAGGLFDNYPGGYTAWATNHGVDRLGRWHPSMKSALEARKWLQDAGILMTQEAELPKDSVTANLGKIELTDGQINVINTIDDAFRTVIAEAKKRGDGNSIRMLKAQHINLTRRALESFKIPRMLELLQKEVAEAKAKGENRKWLIMTATKSDRDLEKKEKELAEKMMSAVLNGTATAFQRHYLKAHRLMIDSGLDLNFRSPIDEIMRAGDELGLNSSRFSGDANENERQESLKNFRSGKSRVMVATLAAGGTGLSVHDTVGGMPITQIILTMPWTGTVLVQAAGRAARYGMKTPVLQHYLFANDPTEQYLAALVGTRLKGMKAIVNGLERTPTADEMIAFDIGDLDEIGDEGAPEMGVPLAAAPTAAAPMIQQPGQPMGASMYFTGNRPPWRNGDPADKAFAKIRAKIMTDTKGDIGVRTILDELIKYFDFQLRVGREQLTKKNLASMLTRGSMPGNKTVPYNVMRTNSPQEFDIDMHEVGHGMTSLDFDDTVGNQILESLGKTNPAWANTILDLIMPLVDRKVYPDSAASAPNSHEAMAEWVRRYVTRPNTFQNQQMVDEVEKYLEQNHPGWLDKLRGASMAYEAHLARPAITQAVSAMKDVRKDSSGDKFGSILERTFQTWFSRGAPLYGMNHRMFKLIQRNLRKEGLSQAEALKKAREWRDTVSDTPADVLMMYQTTNRLRQMAEDAVSGEGLKVFATTNPRMNAAGKASWWPNNAEMDRVMRQFLGDRLPDPVKFGESIKFADSLKTSIADKIPADQWDEWVAYGDYKAALARYKIHPQTGEKIYLSYPGRRDLTPDVMRAEIDRLEKLHPEWQTAFKAVERIYDQVLLMTMLSGQIGADQYLRIKGYQIVQNATTGEYKIIPRQAKDGTVGFSDYWYLLRQNERGMVDTSVPEINRSEPKLSLYRAYGSGMPFDSFMNAFRKRINNALSAWAWRQTLNSVLQYSRQGAIDEELTPATRRAFSRIITPLRPDLRSIGEIGPHEDLKIRSKIAEWWNMQHQEKPIDADEINLSFIGMPLMRKLKPNAKNVVVIWEGNRAAFYQIEDNNLFDMFSKSPETNKFLGKVKEVVAPITQKWKDFITQTWVYVLRNSFARDPAMAGWSMAGEKQFSGVENLKTWTPGYFLLYGIYKMATGSDVMKHVNPELWSRTFEMHLNGRAQIEDAGFMQMLQEGIVIPKDATKWEWIRAKPGQAYAVATKVLDIMNYALGSKAASRMLELAPRIGAAELARENGASLMKALQIADMVTGNFGNRPLSGNVRTIDQMAGFWNANKQINFQFLTKAFDPDPAVRRELWTRWAATSLGLRLGLAAASTALALATAGGDDEKKKRVKAILDRPIDERLRNQSVFMGKVFGMDLPFRIPYEQNVMGTIEALAVYAFEQEILTGLTEGRDSAWIQDLAHRTFRNLSEGTGAPIKWAAGMLTGVFGPQAKTIGEAVANYSFFRDAEIVPDYLKDKGDPNAAVYDSTPTVYPWLSAITGNRIHPLKIQYVAQNAVSTTIDDLFKIIDVASGRRPVAEPADVPIAGRLMFRRTEGWNSQPVRDLKRLEADFEAAKLRYEQVVSRDTVDPKDLEKAEAAYWKLQQAHSYFQNVLKYGHEIKRMTKLAYNELDPVEKARIVEDIHTLKLRMTDEAAMAVGTAR